MTELVGPDSTTQNIESAVDPQVPGPIDGPPSADEWRRLGDEMRIADEATTRALDGLRREWGAQFESNTGLARRLVGEIASPELVAAIEGAGMGDNPHLLRAAAELARRLYRDAAVEAQAPDENGIHARLDTLHALQYSDDPLKRAEYRSNRVQNELERLYGTLYGGRPVVGQALRTA